MRVQDYIQESKRYHNKLFKRYCSKDNKVVEPVVTIAYFCGEKHTVFCHPEDLKYDRIEDFKNEYAVMM